MNDELTDLARKLNRDSSVLKNKIDETITFKNELGSILQDLQGEISEIRNCRAEINQTIVSSTKDSYPELINLMKKEVDTSLNKSINAQLESLKIKIETASSHLQNYAYELKHRQENHESRLSQKGLGIAVVFCLSSILTGAGLWYFFPQHHTTNVEFSSKQRKAMEMGTLLKFAMPKLSKADQEKVLKAMGNSWDEYYKDLLNH